MRRYTNTVSFEEVPLQDKLASMNRHLENKYSVREQALSRMSSQSRQVRGRSIASTRARLHL